MKLIRLTITLCSIALLSLPSQAQKIRLLEGNLSVLKGQTSIGTQYTYENMRVGKFDKEEDYVSNKIATYDKKEPGRGETWAKQWVGDRKSRYEPKFEELFEKHSEMTISAKAMYTLIFKTTYIEPGYNVGVMRHSAEINAEVWIVETANPTNVIAKLSIEHAPGKDFMGNDYDTGERITESYASAGKALGKFIKKKD
jgi:hypothetical protein